VLLDRHSLGTWPTHVPAKAVCPGGSAVVPILFPVAGGAVMVGAYWVEPMQMAVGAHIPESHHLGLPCHALSAAVSVGANVGIAVLIVAHFRGHGGNGGSELLNFSLHCYQIFLHLRIVGCVHRVGCTRACLVFAYFISNVGHLVGRFIAIASGPPSPSILFVGVGGFDNVLKVGSRQVVVGLCGCWLLFPRQHLLLVKAVAIIDFLQIKLELVVVSDGDVRLDEGTLIIIKALPECREVFVSVPFYVVFLFEDLLCLDVEGTPAFVQMLQDLEWSDVAIRREAMFELGIMLFVESVT
jgi:hypothetical protein